MNVLNISFFLKAAIYIKSQTGKTLNLLMGHIVFLWKEVLWNMKIYDFSMWGKYENMKYVTMQVCKYEICCKEAKLSSYCNPNLYIFLVTLNIESHLSNTIWRERQNHRNAVEGSAYTYI